MKSRTIVSLLAMVAILPLLWAAGSAVASPPREGPGGEGGAVIAAPLSESINYQGRLTDPSTGDPVPNGTYTMRFELYDDATAGTLLWDSGNQSVQVANGLFNVKLNVDQEDFNGQALWLRIAVGGQWLTPRREILPVPYALSLRPGAEIAGSVSGDEALHVRNDSSAMGSTGVFGWAYATSGQTFGVWGTSRSTAGTGVYGNADATSGTTYGVYGVVNSSAGHGVHGKGPTYGVYGESTATSGEAWGVHGVSASTSGRGVHGRATATSGTTYGGRFTSDSTSGYGVYGHTTATSGTNYGVYGEVASSSGHGVHGKGPTYGVYGEATHASLGPSAGVFGVSASVAGTGMRGEATATSGETAGVFGWSMSSRGTGVSGLASAESGTTYGVHGEAASTDGHGVHGEAPAYGVYGEATRTSGGAIGVYGVADSSSGYGVHGVANASSGETRGVSGLVQSPDGIAGYFKVQGAEGLGLRVESPGPLISAWDGSPLDCRFRVTNPGNVYADGTFNPGGADLAEMLPAIEGLEPGDVLVIGPNGKLTRSTTPYATNVAGVYSTNPGFVGGSDEDGVNPGKVPLAVVGVARAKVSAENGSIAPGDLLTTSSTPGHAMKAAEHKVGTILGKALGKLQSGTGVIDVLVILQ
jgi:hypothetical protein